MRHRFWPALVVGWTLTTATLAHADPPPTEAEKQAQVKFEAAAAAFEAASTAPDKKKKIEEALNLFQEAAALNRAAGTLRNIALCEEELGRTASAWTHYKEALSLYPPKHKRVAEVTAAITKLEPLVPKLRLRLEKTAPADMKVHLGERDLAASELDKEMPLDPGSYTIRTEAKGYVTRTYEVRLVDKETKSLEVGVGQPEVKTPKVDPLATKVESPGDGSSGDAEKKPFPKKLALTVGVGVGALGLLGAGAGLFAVSESDKEQQRAEVQSLKQSYGPGPCGEPSLVSGGRCEASKTRLAEIDTFGKVGPALMAAGGVATALTIWLAVDPGSKLGTFLGLDPKRTALVPYFTEKEGGAILQGEL